VLSSGSVLGSFQCPVHGSVPNQALNEAPNQENERRELNTNRARRT